MCVCVLEKDCAEQKRERNTHYFTIPFVSYTKAKELINGMAMFLVLCYEHFVVGVEFIFCHSHTL